MTEAQVLSNETLKSLMTDGFIPRDRCTDFNTCITPGFYKVYANAEGIPSGAYGYGLLLVIAVGSNCVSQIYIPNLRNIYVRNRWDAWQPWRHIVTESVVTT